MFELSREEIEMISQTVTSLPGLKFSKRVHAFTEQGVAMLSSVLRQLEDTTSWAYPEGRRLIGFHMKESGDSGTKGKNKR